jgi:hypothetical protein
VRVSPFILQSVLQPRSMSGTLSLENNANSFIEVDEVHRVKCQYQENVF